MAYKTKFHRDGTVTVWNVFSQSWKRISATALVEQCENPFGNLILPTLPATDRVRIERTWNRSKSSCH